MSRMAPVDWEKVVHAHGWGHINLNDKEAGEGGRPTSLSLNADLSNCVAPPLFAAEGFPHWVPGAKSKEVAWAYDTQTLLLPGQYTPNLVYIPQRISTNLRAFKSLHQRYLRNGTALKYETAASTPNLQISMVLVAARRTSPQQQQQDCLAGYFLPFKPGHDVRDCERTYNVWLERRLGERRQSRHRDQDILLWKEDQLRLDRLPNSGMPAGEQLVAMKTYHYDSSSSQYGTLSPAGSGGGGGARMHCCLVQSVLPDRTFTYSLRPWRRQLDGTAATLLEPDMADQQNGFLQECDCDAEDECGKLRAREELKRLRVEGVQYHLEVRRASGLHEDAAARHGQLGVFTREDIPEDTYVFEYVGEWLPAKESEARELKYEPAGLHYLYDLSQRYTLPPTAAAASGKKRRHDPVFDEDVPRVVDATHLGNVARFVNHRCEGANLVSVNMCMGGLDSSHMTILMRTACLIKAGEELTLDYQAGLSPEQKAKIRAKPDGLVPCRCGAACCLGHVFPKIMKEGKHVLERTRRNGAGTRNFGCSSPPGTTTTTTTGAASSTSSEDSAAAGASIEDSATGATTTATTAAAAVAAASLPAEGPPSGISGPATVAARAAAAAEDDLEEQDRGKKAVEEEEEDCCTSAAVGSGSLAGQDPGGDVLAVCRSGSTPAPAGVAAAGPAGAVAAAAMSPRAQERGCTAAAAAGGCSAAGVDAAAGASTSTAAAAAGVRRLDTVRSPAPPGGCTGLKRMRLTWPSPPRWETPKPIADGAGGGRVAAAAAAAATKAAVGAVGATGSTATAPGSPAHTQAVVGGMVSISISSGGGGQYGVAEAAAAPPSGAAAAAACSTVAESGAAAVVATASRSVPRCELDGGGTTS